jgi:hypothetical protein
VKDPRNSSRVWLAELAGYASGGPCVCDLLGPESKRPCITCRARQWCARLRARRDAAVAREVSRG